MERHSGAESLKISEIEFGKDPMFHGAVYEIRIHIDPADQPRMRSSMAKAMESHRPLAFMVHGTLVSQAWVTNMPQDGTVFMGGYGSADEAEAAAARFVIQPRR